MPHLWGRPRLALVQAVGGGGAGDAWAVVPNRGGTPMRRRARQVSRTMWSEIPNSSRCPHIIARHGLIRSCQLHKNSQSVWSCTSVSSSILNSQRPAGSGFPAPHRTRTPPPVTVRPRVTVGPPVVSMPMTSPQVPPVPPLPLL